ncbi:MAG: hypothetical protein ACPGQD_06430, partial [Planctomycetota bacterium]
MNLVNAVRIAVVLGVCWLAWLLRPVTAPLFAAYLLMLVLLPLHRRWRIRLGSSIAAVCCVLLALVLPPLLLLPAMVDFQQLVMRVPIDDLGGLSAQIQEQILALRDSLPAGYAIETGGLVEESAASQASVFAVVPLMLILVVTILMTQLRNFRLVGIVLFMAPLGLIGV